MDGDSRYRHRDRDRNRNAISKFFLRKYYGAAQPS